MRESKQPRFLPVSSLLNTPALACEFLAHWMGGTTLTEVGQLLGYRPRQTKTLVEDGFFRRGHSTVHYDPKAKRWLSDAHSSRLHGPKSPGDVVAVLRALCVWSRGTERLLPVVDTRAFRRDVPADTFRVLLGACTRRQVVDVVYRARTREWAVSFSPHTLVVAPHRDHFRGHSKFEEEGPGHYWDLVPSRVLRAEIRPDLGYVEADDDAEWHTEVVLHLELKADLPDAMRQAIRHEHGTMNDRLDIGPIRRALLPYVRAEFTDRRYLGFPGPVWDTTTSPGRADTPPPI